MYLCALNTGGYAITSTEYLFNGSVAQQLTEQSTDSSPIKEHYRYTYDHAGRLLNTFYKLNNNAEITLSSFSYDETGRMVQNLLHNSIDTVRYSYDMRNMLTKTKHRHYSEYLTYADEVGLSGTTPCYNGNISVKNEGGSPMGYEYDDMNRLTTVFNYMNKFGLGMVRINLEEFSYDEVGNILSLRRKGHDDLAFDYGTEGNQLLSITDSEVDADMYDIIEFSNRALETDSPLLYDANGNLVKDAYRYISRIKYNLLNLPDTIQFSNGHQIVNLYDAVGRKYKTVNYTNMRIVNTDYNDIAYYTYDTDSIVYQEIDYVGNIINIRTKEDSVITGKQKIFNATGYYTDGRYYHYVKNHLGSICLVIDSETGSTVQNISYSASGVPSNIDLEIQPYLYNGKEFISQFGLNEYDSQARYYYPVIGRTTTMDPLAEEYYHISPYAWCGNNPIAFVDPDGRAGYRFKNGQYIGKQEQEGPNYGVILDDNNQQISTFEFADPINDPKAIEEGKINRVQVVNDDQIANILAKSGVEDQVNKTNKYSFALRESNAGNVNGNGCMDYVIMGIYEGATISAYNNYLFVTNTDGKRVAHNTYNFGNFLWGAGMAALGIPYPLAKLGAHMNNFFFDTDSKWHLDSKDDQFSIKLGYLWRQGR